jgi:hypothetical protein
MRRPESAGSSDRHNFVKARFALTNYPGTRQSVVAAQGASVQVERARAEPQSLYLFQALVKVDFS